MRYDVKFTSQFKKNLTLDKKQNKNLEKLFEIIEIPASGGMLPVSTAFSRIADLHGHAVFHD
ncbi:mRNA interferase YafQ [Bifidobacterium pseudocatenulatum]|nr:mRNA interferase YafQ [Bifidobacterium pseudocatenulatum]